MSMTLNLTSLEKSVAPMETTIETYCCCPPDGPGEKKTLNSFWKNRNREMVHTDTGPAALQNVGELARHMIQIDHRYYYVSTISP
jgi:hypothetical protein